MNNSRMIIISLETCHFFVYKRHFLMLFCTMLGLYEFKQLVGENEMVYYHSARNCTFCEYCHFKHII